MVDYAHEHNLNVERFAYADAVKRAVEAIDPFVPDDDGEFVHFSAYFESIKRRNDINDWRDTWDIAKANPEVRRLIQKAGTEAGREIHGHNTWINVAQERVSAAHDDGIDVLIIPDVRFPNEQENIISYNQHGKALNIFVIRPRLEAGLLPHLGSNSTHASETSLDYALINGFIINDGTLDHLKQSVYTSLDEWVNLDQ